MPRRNRRKKSRFGEKQIDQLRATIVHPGEETGEIYFRDLYLETVEKNDQLTFLAEKHRRMAVIWFIICICMFWFLILPSLILG